MDNCRKLLKQSVEDQPTQNKSPERMNLRCILELEVCLCLYAGKKNIYKAVGKFGLSYFLNQRNKEKNHKLHYKLKLV